MIFVAVWLNSSAAFESFAVRNELLFASCACALGELELERFRFRWARYFGGVLCPRDHADEEVKKFQPRTGYFYAANRASGGKVRVMSSNCLLGFSNPLQIEQNL